MKTKLVSLLLAIVLLVGCLPVAAFAAPSSEQVDFISRMATDTGCIVKSGSHYYYSHAGGIWRMNLDGSGKTKQFQMRKPIDLQLHGGYIYFQDAGRGDEESASVSTPLYRFKPGAKSASKYLSNIGDSVIGGNVLYYTNKSRDILYSKNISTGKQATMYSKKFTFISKLNFMQGMLTFSCDYNGKEHVGFYSPSKKNAMLYTGLWSTLLAHGNYLYGYVGRYLVRLTFDASKPSVRNDKNLEEFAYEAVIMGNHFYYDESVNASKHKITKRAITSGNKTTALTYDAEKYGWLIMQPCNGQMWLFYWGNDLTPCLYRKL